MAFNVQQFINMIIEECNKRFQNLQLQIDYLKLQYYSTAYNTREDFVTTCTIYEGSCTEETGVVCGFAACLAKNSVLCNRNWVSILLGPYAGETESLDIAGATTTSLGDRGMMIGPYCGQGAQQQQYGILLGPSAGTMLQQATKAICIGGNAMHQGIQDYNTIWIGSCSVLPVVPQQQVNNAITIGYDTGATTQKINAIVIGYNACYNTETQGDGAIAIGYKACGNTTAKTGSIQNQHAIAIGAECCYNSNQGEDTVSIGFQANSGNTNNTHNVCIGALAQAGDHSTVIGFSAHSPGPNSTVIGAYTANKYDTSVAIGFGTTTLGTQNVCIGTEINSVLDNNSSTRAVIIGSGSANGPMGDHITLIGASSGSGEIGDKSTCIGSLSATTGSVQLNDALILGSQTLTTNAKQLAHGVIIGSNSFIGSGTVQAENAVCIGTSSFKIPGSRQETGSVMIGSGHDKIQKILKEYAVYIGSTQRSDARHKETGPRSVCIGSQCDIQQVDDGLAVCTMKSNGTQSTQSIIIGGCKDFTQHESCILIGGSDPALPYAYSQAPMSILIGTRHHYVTPEPAVVVAQKTGAICIGSSEHHINNFTQGEHSLCIGSNTFISSGSKATIQGIGCTLIGSGSGWNSTQSDYSVALGHGALFTPSNSDPVQYAPGSVVIYTGQGNNRRMAPNAVGAGTFVYPIRTVSSIVNGQQAALGLPLVYNESTKELVAVDNKDVSNSLIPDKETVVAKHCIVSGIVRTRRLFCRTVCATDEIFAYNLPKFDIQNPYIKRLGRHKTTGKWGVY